ncbi:unnamed protein product, partial [Sphacelaria rigidula]
MASSRALAPSWERTSEPTVTHNKSRSAYNFKLRYTRPQRQDGHQNIETISTSSARDRPLIGIEPSLLFSPSHFKPLPFLGISPWSQEIDPSLPRYVPFILVSRIGSALPPR